MQRAGPGEDGRPRRFVVHVWDCSEAPVDVPELDVFGALEALAVPGTVACSECGADIALGPLV